jgi:hypothetical protein
MAEGCVNNTDELRLSGVNDTAKFDNGVYAGSTHSSTSPSVTLAVKLPSPPKFQTLPSHQADGDRGHRSIYVE